MPQPGPEEQSALTQSEVEGLIARVAEAEKKAAAAQAGESFRKAGEAEGYDFRRPAFLAASAMRKLRLEHQEFAGALAARLSMSLRLEAAVQLSRIEAMPYARFVDSINDPACLALFKAEPLRGTCVLELNTRLALAVVDRLMGGPGRAVSLHRDFSEVELALLDGAAQMILSEWCKHWMPHETLRAVLIGRETNARFMHAAQPHNMMLVLAFETRAGDCVEQIQMAFPCATLEPLVRKLRAGAQPESVETPAARLPKWRADLDKVGIRITAEGPPVRLRAGEVAALKVGDVLPLEESYFSRVELKLAGAPKFHGRLGSRGAHWGVEITNILKA